MQYKFHSAHELLKILERHKINKISTLVLKYEETLTDKNEAEIKKNMITRLSIMKQSIDQGLKSNKKSISNLSGKNTEQLLQGIKKNKMLLSEWQLKAISYALANMENNARMGKIVACPTAGSSGVLGSTVIALKEHLKLSTTDAINGLLTASSVGIIIGENATLAGAKGGCQAEIGSAAAMTAAAITEMRGGNPETCFQAAALALKNLLGLVCDPIGGLVEVPCIKRNMFGVMHAITASDIAMCGIKSIIPFDEVVEAMNRIGNMLSPKLRETALGGLAVTKTGKKLGSKFMTNTDAN